MAAAARSWHLSAVLAAADRNSPKPAALRCPSPDSWVDSCACNFFSEGRQSQRGPLQCNAFWSGVGALFRRSARDTDKKVPQPEQQQQQPPTLPEPRKKKGRGEQGDEEEEEEEEEEPYVPEVNKMAALSERVVKEISSRGSTQVTVNNVVKTFLTKGGPKQVIKNVTTKIERGQLVALVGPSGSGKTTLLRIIAGLEPATSGSVLFDGDDFTNVPVQERDVGFMFQSYALFKRMTVADNIAYGLRIAKRRDKTSPEDVAKRVRDLLDLVQLSDQGDKYPPQLSGGQKQRVALARALATEPRLLLLDEPFGALDIIVKQELRSWVRKLQQALQITTIFVTHDQDEAMEMADHMIVFHRGHIVQEGKPFEIYERPKTPFVMNFISDPNVVPSTCLAVRRSGLRTQKPYVLVRTDDVEILLGERLDLPTTPATVKDVNNMGPEVLVEIEYDDGVILEYLIQRYDWEDQPLEVGQRVHLHMKPLLLIAFQPSDLEP